MKFLLKEEGFPNLAKIIKEDDIKYFNLYFHQDFDGVLSAVGVKYILETKYNLSLKEAKWIQYGERSFTLPIQKQPNTINILVDFAQSRNNIDIHIDHHLGGSNYNKNFHYNVKRSNVESLQFSFPNIYPSDDVKVASIIDSANFKEYGITPEMLSDYSIFTKALTNKDNLSTFQLKLLQGIFVDRFLLAGKNKKAYAHIKEDDVEIILEEWLTRIVKCANPSITSLYNCMLRYYPLNKNRDNISITKIKDMQINTDEYTKQIQDKEIGIVNSANDSFKIIDDVGSWVNYRRYLHIQYGGGSMIQMGSYNRYTIFKVDPNAKLALMIWPMGIMQLSKNPFREQEPEIKNLNLIDIFKEKAFNTFAKNFYPSAEISLFFLKLFLEGQKQTKQSVGFTSADLEHIIKNISLDDDIKRIMDKPLITNIRNINALKKLDEIKIKISDIIYNMSGGHKDIATIQPFALYYYLDANFKEELNYFIKKKYVKRDDTILKKAFKAMIIATTDILDKEFFLEGI